MQLQKHLQQYKIVLASQSPRRQQLLNELNIDFTIDVPMVDEQYPQYLVHEQIPIYLAELKANAFAPHLYDNKLIITADTIVWADEKVLGKPKNHNDAVKMLNTLSGNRHIVYTGVCLKSKNKQVSFYASTEVYFKNLLDSEIDYYVTNFKPFDKAGAYGIQEWIGYIGVEKINGSYFNVMGLPIQRLYTELFNF